MIRALFLGLALALAALPAAAQAIIGAGGGGGQALISSVVTSGSQAGVTFSSLPQGYSHLKLIVYGASSGAVANEAVYVQFNGDTGANYDWYQGIINNGAGAAVVTVSGGGYATNQILVGYLNGQSATTKVGTFNATIGGYASTAFAKPVVFSSMSIAAATLAGSYSIEGGGVWHTTSAITSVKVLLITANHFVDGTIVSLYGMP
jgi:hypothetical protein